MRTYLKTLTRKDAILLTAIAATLAFCCVFGASYVVGEGWAAILLQLEVLLTLLAAPAFAAILCLVDAFWDRLTGSKPKATPPLTTPTPNTPNTPSTPTPNTPTSNNAPTAPTPAKRNRKRIPTPAVMFAIMLICWLPWIAANFPGGTYWDTYWQMWQVYPEAHPIALIQWAPVRQDTLTSAWLVDHHPVLTTLIYGAAAWTSDQLTGTWMAGVFVLSTLQVLAYAALLTWTLRRLRRWGTPRRLRLAAFAFCCLMPLIPVWACCVVKDSTFGLFFLPWLVLLVEFAKGSAKGIALTSKVQFANAFPQAISSQPANSPDTQSPRWGVMLALAVMMCLTKKTGVFIVVATAVAACLIYRRDRRALREFAIQGATCAAIMWILLPLVIFPLANISPGGKQEILGPVFQQTARYAQQNGLSEDEATIVDAVVDVDRVRNHYEFDFQDAVKYYYRVGSTNEELRAYLALWAEQGARDPEAYFGSVMALAGQYVAPTTYLNLRMVTVDTNIGEPERHVLWNPPELDWLRNGLDEAYAAVASVPVANLPFLTVTYVLWLPALVLFLMARRRLACGIVFVPLVVVVAFCVIAPVFDARYAWPMLLAVPLLLGLPHAPESAAWTKSTLMRNVAA